MKVKIRKTTGGVQLPKRMSDGAAGYDLYIQKPVRLVINEVKLVPLGFYVEIPKGYYMTIVPRSSLAKKGITVANSPATIDEDYRGEVCVLLVANYGNDYLEEGTRVAQLILKKYETIEWQAVDTQEALTTTERDFGGFGSTGEGWADDS